ncbi:tetracycline resistance protein [Minicystis rosea]|nr:tetracycline resistance protein [Minicystis rosea]
MAVESARLERERRVLVVILVTVFLDAVGFGFVIPLLPVYAASMHAGEFAVGVILACFSGAQLLATPVLGSLSDRHGRRRIVLLSLAGNAAAMVLFAVAVHRGALLLLVVSRALAGATAGNLSACQAAIADVTSASRRASAMGAIGAGLGLGLMAGPALGGVLIGRFGPEGPPLAASAMALLDLALALLLMPETLDRGREEDGARPRPSPRPPIRAVLAERRMATLLSIYFAAFLAMTSVQTAFPLLTLERLGWSAAQIGYAFAGFGVVLFLVQGLLVGRLAKVVGEIPLLMAGVLLETVGMLAIAFGARSPQVIVGSVVVGVGIGITNPVLSTLASRLARSDQQGAVLGVAQSTGSLARTVGPIWSGLLYQTLGASAPFVGGAAATALGFVLAAGLRRRMSAAASGELSAAD